MDSAVKQTITSGQYYIKKFYASEIHIGNNTIQTGPSSGSAHFVVMVVGPEYAPVPVRPMSLHPCSFIRRTPYFLSVVHREEGQQRLYFEA